MKLSDLARQLRPLIEKGVQSLTDNEALTAVTLFPAWQANTAYTTGQRVQYNGTLYSVLQDHTSQADWTPDVVPSLFAAVGLDEQGYPVWSQPTGAHDAYNKGDIVDYNGTLYQSLTDGNIYPPEAYPAGWEVYEA